MRCKIIFFTILIFFSFQFILIAGLTCQDKQLFPTCFVDEILDFERDVDIRNPTHLFLHPVKLLNLADRLLVYQGSFEDVYHQKRGGESYREIWLKKNRIAAILPLQKSFLEANFAFCFADDEFKFEIPSGEKYNLNFTNEKSFAQFILSKRLFPPLFQIGIGTKTLEVSGKALWDYSLEMAISPFDYMKLGLAQRNRNINSFLGLSYEDSFMDLPVNLIAAENDWYFNFDLIKDMHFSMYYQERKLKDNRELSRQKDFFLDPDGDVFSFSSRLNLKLLPHFKFHFGQKKNYLKGRGDFFYLSQKFGKMTGIKVIVKGAFGGVSFDMKKKHFFSSEVEVMRISGEGKGHVETWPFTPTLEDLLGKRLYFRFNGEAEIWRLGFEYHNRKFFFLSLKSSIDYLRIHPSGKAMTWNPVFLIFGVKNLKEYFLEYQRIDVLYLRLGFKHEFKNFSLGSHFSQFIPIYKKTKRITKEKPIEDVPADLVKKQTGGGTNLIFSLSYHLP